MISGNNFAKYYALSMTVSFLCSGYIHRSQERIIESNRESWYFYQENSYFQFFRFRWEIVLITQCECSGSVKLHRALLSDLARWVWPVVSAPSSLARKIVSSSSCRNEPYFHRPQWSSNPTLTCFWCVANEVSLVDDTFTTVESIDSLLSERLLAELFSDSRRAKILYFASWR